MPYANGPIHIGHLVEYIQTDIFVRFLRLKGEDVIYICADDAHGAPIEIKASELGIKPEELIKKIEKEHQEDFKAFNIKFDNYYSTHSLENEKLSKLIYEKLKENGLIYTKTIESFYDEREGRFLPDRYIKGECPKCGEKDQYGDVCESCNSTYKPTDLIEPYSTLSKTEPVIKQSEHYFFKLSKLKKELKEYYKSKKFQKEILNYLDNWLEEGLQDWDISRDGPYFGFKIPGEENKYFYVWLDAPIGYIASTWNYCNKNNIDLKEYWGNDNTKIIHFIGKDIIYFHFLFWPAILMNSGFNVPEDIVVHGFLTVNGEKMSKSRGTFLTAKDFLKKYDAECLRFYYAHHLSKKLADIDLDFGVFTDRVNNELVANIANFCYRTLNFINKNLDGKIKKIESGSEIIKNLNKLKSNIEKCYGDVNFNGALKDILHYSSLGNKYFQDNEPWKLIKEDKEKAISVLGLCLNIVKNLAILMAPIMPDFSEKLRVQLKLDELKWDGINFDLDNHKIGKEEILVEKMEREEAEEVKEELFPLDLQVAKIKDVKEHPDADKLVVMTIDLGDTEAESSTNEGGGERQLVAGLKEHYSLDELKGKKIILVKNLQPAKLRGVMSQGMLLAGDDGEDVGLLAVENSEVGDKVYFDGLENSTNEISFKNFQKLEMVIKGGKVIFDGKILKSDKEDISVEKVGDGARVR